MKKNMKKPLTEDELLKVSGGNTVNHDWNNDSCFQKFGAKENKKKDCERTKGCEWVTSISYGTGFEEGRCKSK